MTQYKSDTTVNTGANENAGWCLSMAQKVLNTPVANPDAWHAWLNAKYKHETRDLPNVAVPLFFSWINRIKGDPNYGKNQGHVVTWIPSVGKFLSSPGAGYGQQWFDSIVAVEKYFNATFVGWAEDLNGKRVAEPLPDQAPAPVAKPVLTGQGGDYHLSVEVAGFVNANDAANHANSNSRVPAGDYKIYNESNGVVNITRDVNQPGWWINPSDNVAPAPAMPSFAVGDTVAPNSADTTDYNGTHVHAWDSSYVISELVGDRAVLKVRGAVWAAMRTSDIHKI